MQQLFQLASPARRKLHQAVTITLLVALLAGLMPPSVMRTVLPSPAAEVAEALLPAAAPAQAAPLAQLTGSNVLTITKSVVDSNNVGPYNYTVTESSPGADWTTVYTASGGSTNAVVNLGTITAAATAPGTITGTVFRDYNSNGTRDTTNTATSLAVDDGQTGVVVTAYDGNGAVAGNATTDANGVYTLTTTLAGPYRLEFTNLPAGYEPARVAGGADNGTSVQFVSAPASGVDFGIAYPADYCQDNPTLCMPGYYNGNASSTSLASMYRMSYTGTSPTSIATQAQMGSAWGVAYQRSRKRVFAAAVVRRHAGLGPQGLGGVYVFNTPSGAGGFANFIDLESAPYNISFGSLGSNSTRGLPATVTQPNHDAAAFDAVGKQGIGDMDMAEDGNYLWLVNLNLRTLVKLDVSGTSAGAATSYAIASMAGAPTCTGGVLRPWALKFYRGLGYLGGVCSAETTRVAANLMGYVLSFNPNNPTSLTTVLTIPLDYRKGPASSGDPEAMRYWAPWHSSTSVDYTVNTNRTPTPILADIEFDRKGALILGFIDRTGMQFGSFNYTPNTSSTSLVDYRVSGDILRACPDASGAYILESNSTCAGVHGNFPNPSQQPQGPGGGEFYAGDFTYAGNHYEIALGALAYLPGATQVVMGAMNPDDANTSLNFSNGAKWLWNEHYDGVNGAGLNARGVVFVRGLTGASVGTPDTQNGAMGKAYGVGDVEILCDLAPIEIGNRVWNDADRDGVQDPDEAPISGVTVELYKNGVKVGQATTNATGEYYFTSGANATDTNTNDNIIHDSGIGILPGTGTSGGSSLYEIRIPNVSGGSKQAALGTNVLTAANTGSNNSIDSDGSASGVNASYTIPYADLASSGYNNHTYDFGFGPATGTIQIVKNAVGNDGSFTFASADPQLDAVSITTVGNTGNSGAAFTKNIGTYTVSEDTPPANWALTSLSCTGDTDNGSVVTLASRQVAIDLDANENIVCTFTNTYTPMGTIRVVKNTVGNDGTFPFSSVDAQLDAVSLTTVGNSASSSVFTKTAGVYTLSEDAPPANWALTNLTCSGDTDNGSTVTLASRQVQIDLDDNENIVCTFTNTYTPPTGTIQLVKNTVGAEGAFAFSSADAQLDAVSITTVGNVGSSSVITKGVGSYTVSEDALPANWALTSLSCTGDTDNGSTVTLASRQVTIDLDANENIVCTFTNTYTPPLPSYTVRKTRLTPDPVRVGDDITYTVQITNTGVVTITTLPLRDSYDRLNILFFRANVLPDDSTNDGQLDWSDLTASFGRDLGPGQSFVVTTVFVARNDTTLLPSGASVNTARVLITPTQTVTAPVRIEAPTAVETTQRQASYTNGQVMLTWQTVSEREASGFNVLRSTLIPAVQAVTGAAATVEWVKLNAELIPAQQPGQASGASYTFTDATVSVGYPYRYVLELVDSNGGSAYRELGVVTTGRLLFFPLLRR